MTLPIQYPDSSQVRHGTGTVAEALGGGTGGGSGAVIYNTLAELRASITFTGSATVLGYYATGDSPPVVYTWIGNSTATENGGTVIQPDTLPAVGRWIMQAVPVIDVRNFGARDGFDSTAAIQAAINYSQSALIPQAVYIPSGTFKINATLTVGNTTSLTIIGDKTNSRLEKIGSVGYIMQLAGMHTVRNLTFKVPITVGSSGGILLSAADKTQVVDCQFQGQAQGVTLTNSSDVDISGCDFSSCTAHGVGSTTAVKNILVEKCLFTSCGVGTGGQGISMYLGSTNICVANSQFVGNNINFQAAQSTIIDIESCHFEGHKVACFVFTGTCRGVTIENNYIASGDAVGGGSSYTLSNINGGSFKFNTTFNQTINFDSTSLEAVSVGANNQTGSGVIGSPPWKAPTLVNSWVQHNTYATLGFMKDDTNTVYLRGAATGGTAPNVMFTLPVGYRPDKTLNFTTTSVSGVGRITVNTDGTVVPSTATANNPSLDNISFKVPL